MTRKDEIFKGLPQRVFDRTVGGNNERFVRSFGTILDNVDTEILSLKSSTKVSTATGTDLDKIGEMFNLERMSGETDVNFRQRIRSHAQGFSGGGTKDSIEISVLNRFGVIVEVTDSLVHIPSFRLAIDSVTLASSGFTQTDIADYVDIIAKAAGVGFRDFILVDLGTEALAIGDTAEPFTVIAPPVQITTFTIEKSTIEGVDRIG